MTVLSTLLPQLAISSDANIRGQNIFLSQLNKGLEVEKEIAASKNIAASYDRGRAEGLKAASVEYSVEIDQLRSEFEVRLIQAKENWDRDQGLRFAESIELAIAETKAELNQLLYKAVVPFVRKSISTRALAEIEELLVTLLGDNEVFELRISGPELLVEILKNQLLSRNIKVTSTDRDTPEVQINSDNFLITTRIVDWLKKIEELGLK
jgi:hypothetical protein